jgi:hypothetical protein
MSSNKITIYWVPLLLAAAFLILGALLPKYVDGLPSWVRVGAIALAVVLILSTGVLAYLQKSSEPPQGGRGGNAKAYGDSNEALGGRGGDAGQGFGGDGGRAIAKGRRSVAKGGEGGKGG